MSGAEQTPGLTTNTQLLVSADTGIHNMAFA
jgi:hypothetical protein